MACFSCDDSWDWEYASQLVCFDGRLYGQCEVDVCGGGCEPMGFCDCECHD